MTDEIRISEASNNLVPVLSVEQQCQSSTLTVAFAAIAVLASAVELIVPGLIGNYTYKTVQAVGPLFCAIKPLSSFYLNLNDQYGLPFLLLFAAISMVPQYFLGKLHVSGLSLLTARERRGQFARILWRSALTLWSFFLAIFVTNGGNVFVAPMLFYLCGCYCGLAEVSEVTEQPGNNSVEQKVEHNSLRQHNGNDSGTLSH